MFSQDNEAESIATMAPKPTAWPQDYISILGTEKRL